MSNYLKGETQQGLIRLASKIVQPLLPNFYKGQAGKICVIGGCRDYTGAPFFAGHSAASTGADLTHIVCEEKAATVIKLYLPDLMVHPYLMDSKGYSEYSLNTQLLLIENIKLWHDNSIVTEILSHMETLIQRSDLFVVGPGFGRDPLMLSQLYRLVTEIKKLDKPIIFDADALYLVQLDPSLVTNYSKAILTPNIIEFVRIAKALDISTTTEDVSLEKVIALTSMVSKKLGNITIVRKGAKDVILQGDKYLTVDLASSPRRVGGQGDTLSGALGTFINWSYNYLKGVWPHPPDIDNQSDATLLACFAACTLVRTASGKAFAKYGRAMQTSNVHEFLGDSYNELFGDGSSHL
ncbi:uncharacterized protein KQ657_005007 [Scheffersomyces spartinae]|uniref:ATP-dependent (S)-NAD(P)H-hydrate dehydratase n=1 Tax=Scheffersomyces spartinae TaxID=45513 RepID=A0A9P8AJ18_9ASCO|nr:uncharacterized protein KQ657_005007 [Scheffersomyces spartinae]KAG7194280.1 hypothetical protein KQ657_005007 [Scheffersomyces spartinae]